MRAGSCNLQVSALSSLTPGSPSGMHYITTPALLSKAGIFSCLCSLAPLVVCTASAPWCRCGVQGREDGGCEDELWAIVFNVQGSKDCLEGKRRRTRSFFFFLIKSFYLVSSNIRFSFLFSAAGNASGSRALKLLIYFPLDSVYIAVGALCRASLLVCLIIVLVRRNCTLLLTAMCGCFAVYYPHE